MPERELDVDLTNHTEKSVNNIPTPEELKGFRAKVAQVLDRSQTIDRTNVPLPPELDGYWCPNDTLSIHAAEQRGFTVDEQYAKRVGLHDQANGKTVIGDVFHMVRPRWMKIEEDNAKSKRYYDTHVVDKRKQKEEKDFLVNNPLPTIMDSKSENISGPQVDEAINPKQ